MPSTNGAVLRRNNNRYYDRHRDRIKASRIHARYGKTTEDYDATLAAQGGGCAACGSVDPQNNSGRFCWDHDHETGEVRELLCQPCNLAWGHFGEDAERAMRFAQHMQFRYIEGRIR